MKPIDFRPMEAACYDGTLESLNGLAIPECSQELGSRTVQLETVEGMRDAFPGDWVMRNSDGGFYIVSAVEYEATFRSFIRSNPVRVNYIVELEPGVFVATGKGDPARCLRRENAKQFSSEKAASRAITAARVYRPFVNAKVVRGEHGSGGGLK